MHAHLAEIVTEAGLKELSARRIERLTRCPQHFLNRGRNYVGHCLLARALCLLAATLTRRAGHRVLTASAVALQQSVARSAKGHRGRRLYRFLFCCERVHLSHSLISVSSRLMRTTLCPSRDQSISQL